MDIDTTHWIPIPGTPNFAYQTLVAIYYCTERAGRASYRVFPASTPLRYRKLYNALAAVGLPSRSLSDQLVAEVAERAAASPSGVPASVQSAGGAR